MPVTDILRWEKPAIRQKHKGVYLDPIVEHSESAKIGKDMLKGEPVDW
jgi:hypothetical protein